MPARIPPLVRRILSRLIAAEAKEPDPWLRDDLRIARVMLGVAARGEAVLCTPHVLASYTVLGLHPEKVWPAIVERRKALGPLEAIGAPPKKPAQAVSLWGEKTKGARAINSRADEMVLRGPRLLPMATASIAALYPNSDAASSAKKRAFTYDEMCAIVQYSGAEHSVRAGTLAALRARGPWPNADGKATGVICVSLIGMTIEGVCCRSTARYRARQAVKRGYWRPLRQANSWSNCPKCGAERKVGTCACGYQGRSRTPEGKANFDEFCRPFMYEIDIEKFRAAQRPREIRHFDARTYAEYKEAAARGEHPNVTPIRKPSQPAPPLPPAPGAPLPRREQPAAAATLKQEHRSTDRQARQLTSREGPKLVNEMRRLMRGSSSYVEAHSGLRIELQPDDPRYRAPMSQENALIAACMNLALPEKSAREFLKLLPRDVGESGTEESP